MFSATNPFSAIRADLSIVLLVRLEHMLNVGINLIVVTLSRALANVVSIELMKRPGLTLRVRLRETGSATDIWLVPYMCLAGVCLSLSLDGLAFSMEGPKGYKTNNCLIDVVVEVRR